MNFSEIVKHCASNGLTASEVEEFCAYQSLNLVSFFDGFSGCVAHGYARGEWDFSLCDAAMNRLIAFANYQLPNYSRAVFEAFDQGEYHHRQDSPDVDPQEKYTKPRIARLITNELGGPAK